MGGTRKPNHDIELQVVMMDSGRRLSQWSVLESLKGESRQLSISKSWLVIGCDQNRLN